MFWSDIGRYAFRGSASGLPDGAPIEIYSRSSSTGGLGVGSSATTGGLAASRDASIASADGLRSGTGVAGPHPDTTAANTTATPTRAAPKLPMPPRSPGRRVPDPADRRLSRPRRT